MPNRSDLTPLRARAMEFLHTGAIITDANQPDNPIIDCNPAFEVLTGYARSEIVGRNCRFLQGEDVDPAALKALAMAIANHKHITVVLKNYRKDGSMFWNELTISPLLDDNGKPAHYIGIQNDITVRETARLELHREKDELSKMNKVLEQKTLQQKNIDDRINELLKQSQSHKHW